MDKKIKEITEELKSISLRRTDDIVAIDAFINEYKADERGSVVKIVDKAITQKVAFNKEIERTKQMMHFEEMYSEYKYICGIDEVGRGPLAGPVVAGAVILPADCKLLYLNDSKKLTEKKREELFDLIMEEAVSVSVGMVDNTVIDDINILNATYEAMRIAINNLSCKPDILLNDAVTIPKVSIKQVSIIKGDAKSISIAAASIVAKVTRDRMMVEFDREYPEYGFASNKGYGSAMHIEALKKYGKTPIHRDSFISHFV